jgi:hypothetical protein
MLCRVKVRWWRKQTNINGSVGTQRASHPPLYCILTLLVGTGSQNDVWEHTQSILPIILGQSQPSVSATCAGSAVLVVDIIHSVCTSPGDKFVFVLLPDMAVQHVICTHIERRIG